MDFIKVEKKDFDMKKFCFCLLSAYTKEGFCNPFFKHFFASIIEMGESCQMAWHKYVARKKSYRATRWREEKIRDAGDCKMRVA